MDHFAGMDVSVKETSVCIVDDTGKIVREVKIGANRRSAASADEPHLLPFIIGPMIFQARDIKQ